MNVLVHPDPFLKVLKVPTSKSYANRLLILASLYASDFVLRDINLCDDVALLIEALKKIGLQIEEKEQSLFVRGQFPQCEKAKKDELVLELGDGGTTVRFLLALLAKGERPYRLALGAQMKKRPLQTLIDKLNELGAQCSWQGGDLLIQGPLTQHPHEIYISTQESSQFASALALALAPEKIKINVESNGPAQNYFLLTQKLIADVQKSQRDFLIPVDFSSLAFPLSLAALTGKVLIPNCVEKDLFQADSCLLDLFHRIGIHWSFTPQGLECEKVQSYLAFEQDCRNCQDLVPVLAYLASFAEGESVLCGLENLRFKETDRIQSILEVLHLFSISSRFDEKSSSLYIRGGKSFAPFVRWNSLPDHRMIMMVYLFMRTMNGGEILDAHYVSKSFPHFFDLMNP